MKEDRYEKETIAFVPADAGYSLRRVYAIAGGKERPAFADTLGWILYRKGMYPSAVPYLKQATTDPRDAVARYHLAMAYAKAGDRQRSIATLQAALKLNPGLPEAKLAQEMVGVSH